MASVEERVEEHFKGVLDSLGILRFGKTETLNPEIGTALASAASKSGGSGGNYPDIQCMLDNGFGRRIPVMMECKGSRGRLERLDKDGGLADDVKATQNYAVNGAVHYGQVLLSGIESLKEVIVIGMNGTEVANGTVKDPTCKAYYISRANGCVPKHIRELDNNLTLLAGRNVAKLYALLDSMSLTDEEREAAVRRTEERLEASVKGIHQALYDDPKVRTLLGTNEKLYLFCGLIMAGLSTPGVYPLTVADFHGNDDESDNDGTTVLNRIESFLKKRGCGEDKRRMVKSLLEPVFCRPAVWKPDNGVSMLRWLY